MKVETCEHTYEPKKRGFFSHICKAVWNHKETETRTNRREQIFFPLLRISFVFLKQ